MQAAHVLESRPEELCGQLVGRLPACEDPKLRALVREARACAPPNALLPHVPEDVEREALPHFTPLGLTSPDGAQLRTFLGHSAPVSAVVVSENGALAMTGDDVGETIVWHTQSGRELQRRRHDAGEVIHLALARDGRRALGLFRVESSGPGSSAMIRMRVWELGDDQVLLERTITGAFYPECRVALSGSGSRVAVVPGNKDDSGPVAIEVAELETADRKEARWSPLPEAPAPIHGITFDESGSRVIAACEDGKLRLWDVSTSNYRELELGWKPHFGCRLASSLASSKVVVQDRLRVTCLDLEVGEAAALTLRVLPGDIVGNLPPSVRRDGQVGVTYTPYGFHVWDLASGQCLGRAEGQEKLLAVAASNPDLTHVISASGDGTVRVWCLEEAALRHPIESVREQVRLVAVSGDSRRALFCGYDHNELWDIAGIAKITTLDTRYTDLSVKFGVRAMALDRSGATAFFALGNGHDEGELEWWDLAKRERLQSTPREKVPGDLTAVAHRSDGRAIACSDVGTMVVWDPRKPEWLDVLTGGVALPMGATRSRRISPDLGRVAFGLADGRIAIRSVGDGQWLELPPLAPSPIGAMAFGADGRHLVSAAEPVSGEGRAVLTLWDLTGPRPVVRFEAGAHAISSLALRFDARQALSADRNGVLRLWDLQERKGLSSLTAAARIGELVLADDHVLAVDLRGRTVPIALCGWLGADQGL